MALSLSLSAGGPDLADVPTRWNNLGQEVACAAGGFQKARLNLLGFLFHQVEHGIDFARAGKVPAVLSNLLFGDDLFFHEYRNYNCYNRSIQKSARQVNRCLS